MTENEYNNSIVVIKGGKKGYRTFSLVATGLVHELGLGTDIAAPGE